MARTRVAVLRTQPETYEEDFDRLLRLLGNPPVDALAMAPPAMERPGEGALPWQLDAALQWMTSRTAGSEGRVFLPAEARASALARRIVAAHSGVFESTGAAGSQGVESTASLPLLRTRRAAPVSVSRAWSIARPLVLTGWEIDARTGPRGAVAARVALAGLGDEGQPELAESGVWEELLVLQREWATPVHVVDATIRGPVRSLRVENVLVAGSDAVACDATMLRLLGLDPESVPWLTRLSRAGAGVVDSAGIEVLGEMPRRTERLAPLRLRRTSRSRWGRRLATASPISGWNRWRRSRVERIFARTPWGRLWATYASGGMLREAIR
jgi:hypothetical protein